ncbi:hypothetical protein OQA88_4143 [Cercophora sp. LCS_1]
MEPPVKRSRVGPSPFDNEPDDDELNSRPEEVNARRDPGYQLQKSRAFAAFKLKSAFERIFEKYEKDFAGVGDEIDLRTGEIVVNNGHIQSLKTVQLNAPEDEQDEEVDEEERILRGRPDNRLSLMARNPMPLALQPRPPFSPASWGGGPQLMGAPLLSSILHSGQMQFGNRPVSVHYGAPSPMHSFDPAWSAPELPSSAFGTGFQPVLVPRTKGKMRQILASGAEDDNEDDLLLGVAATSSAKTAGRETAAAQRPSSPIKLTGTPVRPKESSVDSQSTKPPESARREPAKVSGISRNATVKAGSKQKRTPKSPIDIGELHSSPLPIVGSTRATSTQNNNALASLTLETPGSERPAASEALELENAKRTPNHKVSKKRKKTMLSRSSQNTPLLATAVPISSPRESSESDLYYNPSRPNGNLLSKPSNQKLRVEIGRLSAADISSYAAVIPEASPEPQNAELMQLNQTGAEFSEGLDKDKAEESVVLEGDAAAQAENSPSVFENNANQAERPDDHGSGAAEVFSRNTMDPSYAFSDEDEPLLSRRKRGSYSTTATVLDERPPNEPPNEPPIATPKASSLSKKPRRKNKVVQKDYQLSNIGDNNAESSSGAPQETPPQVVNTTRLRHPGLEVPSLEIPCSEGATPEVSSQLRTGRDARSIVLSPNDDASLVLESIEQFWENESTNKQKGEAKRTTLSPANQNYPIVHHRDIRSTT